jgi:23S rRNA pseudouridine1911/1915/1917 synthase
LPRLATLIDERSAGKTLIDFIAERFSYHNPDYWLNKISAQQVTINTINALPDQVLCSDDNVEFLIKNFEEPDIDCDYKTIWKNDFLFAINKPAGLPVHSTRRFYYQTLVAEIRRREGFADINPLQRLDRETSGIMLLTRTGKVPHRFHKRAKTGFLDKFYICLVRGRVSWQHKFVNTPLSEAKVPPIRYRMIPDPLGKSAETDFFLIDQIRQQSMLLARLKSGRKHQIRAHLELLKHPLIGEKLYCRDGYYFLKRCADDLQDSDLLELGATNHLLHAYAVRVRFPVIGEQTFFAKEPSAEFQTKLAEYSGWQSKVENQIEQLICSDQLQTD